MVAWRHKAFRIPLWRLCSIFAGCRRLPTFPARPKRFERTWSVEASVSAPVIGPDEMRWTIITKGGNWRVENQFRLVRWDDVIQGKTQEPLWRRLPLGIFAFFDFAFGGALRAYLRINWHYA